MKYLFSLLATLLISIPAHAFDRDRAINNLASDCVECACYFQIVSSGTKESGRTDLSERYEAMSKLAFQLAISSSNAKTTESRAKLYYADMIEKIDGDYSNVSRLMVDYGEMCKLLMENPEQRLQYWLDRK